MWDFFHHRKDVSKSLTGMTRAESNQSVGSTCSQEQQEKERKDMTRAKSVPRELRNLIKKVISFKDYTIVMEAPESSHAARPRSSASHTALPVLNERRPSAKVAVEKDRLVIIMVGLPARGKTFLCNKIKCYLNWLGHTTAHFNVGQYRRTQNEGNMGAAFFDHKNAEGMAARERAFQMALEDMLDWLFNRGGQVAIFDATNSTQERRSKLISTLLHRVKFIFIETICNDPQILETNYLNKMRYSPDYHGQDTEKALVDFKARISKYEEVYEAVEDRSMHFIKLTNMVTGRGHIDVNRISGYIPGKIVFLLMQVCKCKMANPRKIWLTRHGESRYNQQALLGGDSELSPNGEAYATVLPDVILSRVPKDQDGHAAAVSVWTSTLRRTIQTAQHLPFPKLKWKALDEIDAGICDGMTYAQVAERYPSEFTARKKDKLRYRYPRGESYLDVIQRLEPVITELEREAESVVVVGHQAILRAVFGYLMARPQEEIPTISIPLHTVIELSPMPDGTMGVAYIPVPIATSHKLDSSMDTAALAAALAGMDMEALGGPAAPDASAAAPDAAGRAQGLLHPPLRDSSIDFAEMELPRAGSDGKWGGGEADGGAAAAAALGTPLAPVLEVAGSGALSDSSPTGAGAQQAAAGAAAYVVPVSVEAS